MKSSAERVIELELENKQLKEELNQYQMLASSPEEIDRVLDNEIILKQKLEKIDYEINRVIKNIHACCGKYEAERIIRLYKKLKQTLEEKQ